jgi:hypothetical protein
MDMDEVTFKSLQHLGMNTTTPAASYATSSYATAPAASYATSSYTTPTASDTTTIPIRESRISAWSEWCLSEERQCDYRYRENSAEPDGFEYEYLKATVAPVTVSNSKHQGRRRM